MSVAGRLECEEVLARSTRQVLEEETAMQTVAMSVERRERRAAMHEMRVRRIAGRWGVGEVEIVRSPEGALEVA
jgi:type VI protein secretion system component VasK